jgi:hypothetical protein
MKTPRRTRDSILARLKVARVDAPRRARTARAMAAAGWPHWRIRACLGMSRRALCDALILPRDVGRLWSAAEARALAAFMAEAA